MLPCFARADEGAAALEIRVVTVDRFADWLAGADETARQWIAATGFRPVHRALTLLPAASGELTGGVFVLDSKGDAGDAAHLARALPAIDRHFTVLDEDVLIAPFELLYGWALAGYRFDRYRKPADGSGMASLTATDTALASQASELARSVFLARDLVNTPASDMGPDELEVSIREIGGAFDAEVKTTKGDALLEANYPAVHAVGRASSRQPRLIDLTWGDADAPRLTLVGKGVCFDTGGLDIKPAGAMRNMKKDMGGAACMAGLARMVMASGMRVRLRLLVPAVENSISANAFRPGDVLQTRKGLTVEVGNTDAEGRLVLADALAEADRERPEMIIDAATLTGAARVAVGTELPALFSPDDDLANDILAAGEKVGEPLCRLPLYPRYRDLLKSSVADLSSTGSKPFAGAITAALFLERFVSDTRAYAHLDIFAWNDEGRPGRPRGGEATGLRALFAMLESRFGPAA